MYKRRTLGFDRIDFKISYHGNLLMFHVTVNSKWDLARDKVDFAKGRNGPLNVRCCASSDHFHGARILDPDGLIYGKPRKHYVDLAAGVLQSAEMGDIVVFLRRSVPDGQVLVMAETHGRVYFVKSLLGLPGQTEPPGVLLWDPIFGEESVFPKAFFEMKRGAIQRALIEAAQVTEWPPPFIPLETLSSGDLVNFRVV